MDKRSLFLQNVAQTSELSLALNISHAMGMYIYDQEGNEYLDLNSGISVSSLGHRHPNVVEAVQSQLGRYMHTMVYGEHIQSPQVRLATKLLAQMNGPFEKVYYVMSGTEAVELAMKLGRLYTNRFQIIANAQAYHGSTIGAESLRSDLAFTKYMAPGVPGISHIKFNDLDTIDAITSKTACVITEVVQAEAGVQPPKPEYLKALRKRCTDVGALLVFDEIQTGFHRTGPLFAYQKYNCTPDIVLSGKAMGGGMPIAAVISSSKIMQSIVKKPALAHITTFGGHPVCVAAAEACFDTLELMDLEEEVPRKAALFVHLLNHQIIKEIRHDGLMMAVELTRRKYLKHVVEHTIKNGALIDYFLFNNRSFRLAPPLIINDQQIRSACKMLLASMDYALSRYEKKNI